MKIPMPKYIQAWKIYRNLSDENAKIGDHISSRLNEKYEYGVNILDIGTGDGKCLHHILLNLAYKPKNLTCVEPDRSFNKELQIILDNSLLSEKRSFILNKIFDADQSDIEGHDVIICTHAAYFLTSGELLRLFNEVKKNNSKLFIVIDDPDSIFSKLWSKTATTYLNKVQEHILAIKGLTNQGYCVKEKTIDAILRNPFELRSEVKNILISMLCYSDIDNQEAEMQKWIEGTIKAKIFSGRIQCTSTCYEITYAE